MDPYRRYPFLRTLLSSFEKRHQKTLALVIAAIASAATARSFSIGMRLSDWLGTRLDSAVNRFYRLLRNHRIDDFEFLSRWCAHLVRSPDRHLLVAVDWTEWHHGLRMLVAAVVTGKRAIPLFAQAFEKLVRRRSQNVRENTFLRLLAHGLRRARVKATILCDRGFRRVSWIRLLQQLDLGFVVRLQSDVMVELSHDVRVPLNAILLRRGRIMDLGIIRLRSDGKVAVRVIGFWAPGAPEPWWLATDSTTSAHRVLSLYDRRMAVEEHFRDTKGCRFGVKLAWTQFRNPEALARFVMLLAVALLIWTLAGIAAAARYPWLRLPCKKKGPRQSYVTIGLQKLLSGHLPVILSVDEVARLLEPPTFRRIGSKAKGGK